MRSGNVEVLGTRSPSPILTERDPRKQMNRHKRSTSRIDQENTPPVVDPNVMVLDPLLSPSVVKNKSPLFRKTRAVQSTTDVQDPTDLNVKVVVRIRPPSSTEEEENRIVRKVSPDSLSVESKTFKFSCVFGPGSSQEDVFQLVGAPLVQDSLDGFNTSVICYGETGSGKTYTMWGPLSAMLDDRSASVRQGIAPRIFHMLFTEIEKIKEGAGETQINFQCRCSFLEIYNEQISDLLDPVQRNLKIKEDAKNSFYVENLSEEYVTNIDDVIQILVKNLSEEYVTNINDMLQILLKGLSNRRAGATSVNSKSSRSHIILTCIIESWCKGTTSKAFNNSKFSRISLVDLAGSERNTPDDASGRYKKEGKHIKKSLSKLGNLVNSLTKVDQSEGNKIFYGNSCLTNLLRDSLGGNAKSRIICAVSPVYRCKSGTLSTLRFGQAATHVQNKAVVNEITEDHVNNLTDQIRQLKEELIREKTCGDGSVSVADGYFKRHNVRGSLNLLKASLNRSLSLYGTENNLEDEVDADVTNVDDLCKQLNTLKSSLRRGLDDEAKGDFADVLSNLLDVPGDINSAHGEVHQDASETVKEDVQHELFRDLSSSIQQSQDFVEPPLSLSPRISNNRKKSLDDNPLTLVDEDHASTKLVQTSLRRSDLVRTSLHSSKLSPTDSLAASLQRGLQIIDYHQRNSVANNSSVSFSFDYLKNSWQTTNKVDASIQTFPDANSLTSTTPYFCTSCKQINTNTSSSMEHNSAIEILSVNQLDEFKEKSEEAVRRASELERTCSEQEGTIKQLNHQVEQYKQQMLLMVEENKGISAKKMTAEDNICLEAAEKSSNVSEANSHNALEIEGKHDTSFDVIERAALLEEIQTLKKELLSYTSDSAENLSLKHNILLQSTQLNKNGSLERMTEDFEKERKRWTEAESRWISFTDELRMDLESSRVATKEKDIELASEKRCSEELDDALQRSILGHVRMVEHIAELQEKYTCLMDEHRKVMDGIAQVNMAAAKAGKKGTGSAFAQALNSELCSVRAGKEKERRFLKEQNKVLQIQLRDTAEAVHAAGELLVKLREAEENASVAEEKYARSQQETEKCRKQMEKMKRKHTMEMLTMKHYMDESRLPECALEPPLYKPEDSKEDDTGAPMNYDTHSWRAAFEPSYR